MKNKTIYNLFDFTEKTLYNWKKEDRPILELIEKYFTDNEIKEFLEKREISKWEFLKHSYDREMNENIIAFKNILDDISDELINFNDKGTLENMSIIFMKIILFLSDEANISKFYNISELIMVYAREKDEGLSDSIIELNKIVSSKVHNKSFIPFLHQLGRNDLIDLFNDKPFELKKYEIEHYFVQYILPYWNLKYIPKKHKELQQTGYHKSQDIFDMLFNEYSSEENYTKREMIKVFKEYYNDMVGT